MLDDIDAKSTCCACVAPNYCVMARDTATALDESTAYRKSAVKIDQRHKFLYFSWRQNVGIYVIYFDRIRPAPHSIQFMQTVRQCQDTSLAQHHVEIKFLTETLIKLQ